MLRFLQLILLGLSLISAWKVGSSCNCNFTVETGTFCCGAKTFSLAPWPSNATNINRNDREYTIPSVADISILSVSILVNLYKPMVFTFPNPGKCYFFDDATYQITWLTPNGDYDQLLVFNAMKPITANCTNVIPSHVPITYEIQPFCSTPSCYCYNCTKYNSD